MFQTSSGKLLNWCSIRVIKRLCLSIICTCIFLVIQFQFHNIVFNFLFFPFLSNHWKNPHRFLPARPLRGHKKYSLFLLGPSLRTLRCTQGSLWPLHRGGGALVISMGTTSSVLLGFFSACRDLHWAPGRFRFNFLGIWTSETDAEAWEKRQLFPRVHFPLRKWLQTGTDFSFSGSFVDFISVIESNILTMFGTSNLLLHYNIYTL